jgi:hypothetical protein
MHANVIFANSAYHQLGSTANTGGAVAHIFDDTFRVIKSLTKVLNVMNLLLFFFTP